MADEDAPILSWLTQRSFWRDVVSNLVASGIVVAIGVFIAVWTDLVNAHEVARIVGRLATLLLLGFAVGKSWMSLRNQKAERTKSVSIMLNLLALVAIVVLVYMCPWIAILSDSIVNFVLDLNNRV